MNKIEVNYYYGGDIDFSNVIFILELKFQGEILLLLTLINRNATKLVGRKRA